tara:strand:- start:1869 stop:2375 length:507 start_codon:yes stop_codon:yes gene_type:complete
MEKQQSERIVTTCPLCGKKELQILEDKYRVIDGNPSKNFQCLSCGYSTNDDYKGDIETNEAYKATSETLKQWVKLADGYIWLPSVVNLPVGVLYPHDGGEEMKWAFAPIVEIPEEEQKNYPVENKENEFYKTRLDTNNEVYFNTFKQGIFEIEIIVGASKEVNSGKNT